ncbi:MAG: cyclic pyranopterin monophosphate synthase accessory protein [Planctomycetota bacterium]|nr:MAG: cyclic pyranopterin monophosphate synthase accessory protein [Planctomycetota bacterium]
MNSDPHGFTHLDAQGRATMVDVSDKPVTLREAVASARLVMRSEVRDALFSGRLPKGDALAAARLAGIAAAKKTSDLIPLCHVLPLEFVGVDLSAEGADAVRVHCTARALGRTGVEMEALVGATVAALTLYDMAKSADRAMTLGPVRLESKRGGRSGDYRRSEA